LEIIVRKNKPLAAMDYKKQISIINLKSAAKSLAQFKIKTGTNMSPFTGICVMSVGVAEKKLMYVHKIPHPSEWGFMSRSRKL